jgi:Transglutaminase-like superfamily
MDHVISRLTAGNPDSPYASAENAMHWIHVDVPAVRPGLDPLGLLIPVPPATLHQCLESIKYTDGLSSTRLNALNAGQEALFVPGSNAANRRFAFRFGPGAGVSPAEHFTPIVSRYSRPSAELTEGVNQLTAGSASEREKLQRIVNFAASLFDYDHPAVKFYDGKDEIPLLKQLTKGSCIDINTFLMTSLQVAGIPAAYYAGYFFEAGQPPTAVNMHCWVSTFTEGEQQDWDIAHQITSGARDIVSSLNPKPGIRFAMSCGRGLMFPINERPMFVAHLGFPTWLRSDGGSERAEAVATLVSN